MNEQKILIIGCGALGSFFATRFLSQNIKIILRQEQYSASFYQHGVSLISNSLIKHKIILPNDLLIDFDLAIISVKTYDLEKVIEQHYNILQRSNLILLLQSSIELKKLSWNNLSEKLYAAGVMFGVIKIDDGIALETNPGFIEVGCLFPEFEKKKNTSFLVSVLNEVTKVRISNNIDDTLLSKILINSLLFPFCIIGGGNFLKTFSDEENISLAARLLFGIISKLKLINPNFQLFSTNISELISIKDCYLLLGKIVTRFPHIYPSTVFDIILKKNKNELELFFIQLNRYFSQKNLDCNELQILSTTTNEYLINQYYLNEKYLKRFIIDIKNKIKD